MTRPGKKDRIYVLMEPILEDRWDGMQKEDIHIQRQ